MSRQRLRWAATAMPAMRRIMRSATEDQLRVTRSLMEEVVEPRPWLRTRHGPHMQRLLEGGAIEEFEQQLWALGAADLFWITHQMTRVAMEAALDLPSFAAAEAPSRYGIMAFERPLPPLRPGTALGVPLRGPEGIVSHDDPVAVDVLSWRVIGGHVWVDAWCQSSRLPWPVHANEPELSEIFELKSSLGFDLDGAPTVAERRVFSLLGAAWHLMQIPTLAERRSLDAEWGGGATDRTRPDRLVTTIDLRPLRHVQADDDRGDDEGDKRRLSVRHYVRGHWRNQPCGPNHSERRLTYVEPYIKGPPGAPLIHSEKVMVWRR